MVLGKHPKVYKHMMKNMISSLIIHERIQTTHAKAKHLVKAANKLIHFAKKADKGFTSPLNLLKGRVTTEQVYKKLLMETVPRLENIPQNYVSMSKIIRRRRGDNAPLVNVTIRGSEKEEVSRLQAREAREKSKQPNIRDYHRHILAEEKAYYQKLIQEQPQKADFFKAKIAKVQFDEWALDKKRGQRRVQLLV